MSQLLPSRTVAKKEMQSMPDIGIPYSAAATDTIIEGSFSAISIFAAAFPDDEKSFEIAGTGVNLSKLNDVVPDGFTYLSNFTKVTIPANSEMVLIIYGF